MHQDGTMKRIINSKVFSTIIFFLSIVVIVKLIWLTISLLFLPNVGEDEVKQTQAKTLYYRVKLANQAQVISTTSTTEAPKPTVGTMQGITLLALYNASDALVVTVAKGSKTTVLAKGEMIDGFMLHSAGPNHAIFTKGGKEFKLTLTKVKNSGTQSSPTFTPPTMTENKEESAGIRDNGTGTKVVERNLLGSYTKNVDKIWKDIGINENKVNGQLNGFKINFVKKGSDFEKLGLQRGDILQAINAQELNSYNAAMNFYKEMDNIDNLTLKIQRNNQEMELEYEIQ